LFIRIKKYIIFPSIQENVGEGKKGEALDKATKWKMSDKRNNMFPIM